MIRFSETKHWTFSIDTDWCVFVLWCYTIIYINIDTCYSSSIHILYYISYISSSIYCSLAFASTLSWSRGSHRSWSQGQRDRSSMVRKCQESFGHQVAGDVRSVEDLLIFPFPTVHRLKNVWMSNHFSEFSGARDGPTRTGWSLDFISTSQSTVKGLAPLVFCGWWTMTWCRVNEEPRAMAVRSVIDLLP